MIVFQDSVTKEKPLIDAPMIAPLLVDKSDDPDKNCDTSQPVPKTSGTQLLSEPNFEEDLMVFTPESSLQLAKSLPASPKVDGCWTGELVTRPGTGNPVGREEVITAGLREHIDYEAMLFHRPAQAHLSPSGPAIGTRAFASSSFQNREARPYAPSGGSQPSALARHDEAFASYPLFTSQGRNAVITRLPPDVTKTFILQRIRGGKVANCCLTKFKGKNMVDEETIAVVTFEDSHSAEDYVNFLRGGQAQNVWKWNAAAANADDHGAEYKSANVMRYVKMPEDPLTGLSSISVGYQHPQIPPATRCLVLSPCPVNKLQRTWNDFDLPRLLSSHHYRTQIEDIWYDGYERNTAGKIASGALHIRYASIQMAVDAKNRVMRKPWAVAPPGNPPRTEHPLRYESDPCDSALTALADPVADHEGYQYLRGENLSLLSLNDTGLLSVFLEDLRAQLAATTDEGTAASAAGGNDEGNAYAAANEDARAADSNTTQQRRCWGENWGPGSGATSYYWKVSMDEFLAMDDDQWMAFETCFYVPPEGFNTPETATAERVSVHWD